MDEPELIGPPEDYAPIPVGLALARLRRNGGLTGQKLGQRVGMSQAKISKIETGAVVATPADVELLARALGASNIEVRRLVEQAEQVYNQMTDGRLGNGGLAA